MIGPVDDFNVKSGGAHTGLRDAAACPCCSLPCGRTLLKTDSLQLLGRCDVMVVNRPPFAWNSFGILRKVR